MAWFPEEYKEFQEQNVADADGFLLAMAAGSGEHRLPMNDVTFIIPYATDCVARIENLCSVLSWLITQTTSKVIVTLAESEGNWDRLAKRGPGSRTGGHQGTHCWLSQGAWERFDQEEVLDTLFENMITYRFFAKELKNIFGWAEWSLLRKEFADRIELIQVRRSRDEPFHRTKYLNMMLDRVKTTYVVNHDADVILDRTALVTAISYLRYTDVDAVYPYGYGDFQLQIHDTAGPACSKACLSGNCTYFSLNLGRGSMIWQAKYGHSIFFRTASYKKMGGENEDFISWGAEDVERYVRMLKLRLQVARIKGSFVYHLEHPRGPDSSVNNPLFQHNEQLWDELQALSPQQIKEYYSLRPYYSNYETFPSLNEPSNWMNFKESK